MRTASLLLAVTCVMLPAPSNAQSGQVTFAKDIAPIFFEHCTECHRPGEIGGFSLLAFSDARPRAATIVRVTRARTMPPWKPDAIEGLAFEGARGLTTGEIDTIQRWVETGAPEGNPADAPAPPTFADGWRLGKPDLELTMSTPYVLSAGSSDVLRNVVLRVPLTGVKYVRGYELRPDNRRVVHHANIRVDRTRTARTLDGVDGAPGFDGRLNAGAEFPDGHFLGWTPGQLPPLASDDNTWRLDPGSDLVVQLHLRPTDQTERVQIRLGLYLTERAPRLAPVTLRLGRQNIDIAPGRTDYQVADRYRLPVDVELLSIQPHAHYRAREVSGAVELPDGRVRPLLHIGDWDFDWQDQYRYVTPVSIPKGSTLSMTFRYDNSVANRRNPDHPPQRVRWGQRSVDEMGDVWFQVRAKDESDRRRLMADFGPKVLAEDATGYETLLDAEPGNARLHEAAGALRLSLGDVPRAIEHLEAALAIDPRSAEAHYNLATALVRQHRDDEAVAHLTRALELAPDHVGAHVNLGAVLRARGNRAGATDQLQRALALDPRNAAAHTHLGGLLLADRRIADAMQEYRLALDSNPDLLEPLTELAWTLATSPDGSLRRPQEAVALAERAHRVAGDSDLRVLDASAAAYASAGRYTDAVSVVTRALALLPPAPDAAETRRLLQSRLALYRKGQPFRDESRTASSGR